MPEQKIEVFTPKGIKIGYFTNPSLHQFAEHHYQISGQFHDPSGKLFGKVEYNPQVLPYKADISSISKCGHKQIIGLYVQRGRQPVEMTGSCPE